MGFLQAGILEWVAIPFSRGSSRDRTWVSHIVGRFFSIWATRRPCKQVLDTWLYFLKPKFWVVSTNGHWRQNVCSLFYSLLCTLRLSFLFVFVCLLFNQSWDFRKFVAHRTLFWLINCLEGMSGMQLYNCKICLAIVNKCSSKSNSVL